MSNQLESTVIINISLVIILFLNILYNIMMINLIAKAYLFKMDGQIAKVKDKIFSKYPLLKFLCCDFKKPLKTLDKWINLRRLTARYLRERTQN